MRARVSRSCQHLGLLRYPYQNVHIVLVHPLIPQNTGNIARLSAATGTDLHLIEPLGFRLSDRYLKRAGLDYWSEVRLSVHRTWDQFLEEVVPNRLWLFTTRASTAFTEVSYQREDYLVFGNESEGLPDQLHESYAAFRLRIPFENQRVRSLNLSNSVAVALYEARRQVGIR